MKDDLPTRADALLAAHSRPKDAPFYSESTFRYKLRTDPWRVFRRVLRSPCPISAFYLRLEWLEVVSRAKLTAREADVIRGIVAGGPPEEIAKRRGVSRQTIHQAFRRGIEKIRAARDVYPYADFSEVYLSELNRGRRKAGLR